MNPIKLIWLLVKSYVAKKNPTLNITNIKKLVEESLANVTQGNGRKPLFDIKKTEKNFKVDFGEESLQYVGKVCFIRFRIIQSDTDHLFSSSSDDGL